MPPRRILSLWFPRLAAERILRRSPDLADQPLAIVADRRGALLLASLSGAAAGRGLRLGMALGDARAICPTLVTRPDDPVGDVDFLAALRRWAGRFSPWVAVEGADALILDITGCAHLFGGEAALAEVVAADAAGLGLSLGLGIADTVGAAWAVARYPGAGARSGFAGDAIDQEARATRSRAQKRGWERGDTPPLGTGVGAEVPRIVPPEQTRAHLGPLPVAALRLSPVEVRMLNDLGLRRIEDLLLLPRAQLGRRAGPDVLRRIDQTFGKVAEPVSAARPPHVFALRLTLPEPVGLLSDVMAGLDRLLAPLCARLVAAGQGARRVRLTLTRVDGRAERREIALARATQRPEPIRHLFAPAVEDIDAGFGIEALRLAAVAVEPLIPRQHRAPLAPTVPSSEGEAMGDLIGRLGARLGPEALTRLRPADSHIPEKSAVVMAAAFSDPAAGWRAPAAPRPLLIFPPEPIRPGDGAAPPGNFVWRRRSLRRGVAYGPERIAPEWWLDDPAWRSGARDYWRVETTDGTRLWLFEAKGGELGAGWFAQGIFA